jgi:hypothetical protein
LSYDFDTDPVKRKELPEFYGYVPDSGKTRTVLYICLALNSTLLLLIRSFSSALLMLRGSRYLFWYAVGDVLLFLAYKFARGDFMYWLPIDGPFGYFVSFLFRAVVKFLSDYTGVVQFRHPYELGGAYWSTNFVASVLFSFVSVIFYLKGTTGGGEAAISGSAAWKFVGYLSSAWAMTSALILAMMKEEYRKTFFTTKTGKQLTMDRFNNSGDEAVQIVVFNTNKLHWEPIRPLLAAWVGKNWWSWKREKPDFFTDSLVAKIPLDMIPEEDSKQAQRRRSSIQDILGSSVVAPMSH